MSGPLGRSNEINPSLSGDGGEGGGQILTGSWMNAGGSWYSDGTLEFDFPTTSESAWLVYVVNGTLEAAPTSDQFVQGSDDQGHYYFTPGTTGELHVRSGLHQGGWIAVEATGFVNGGSGQT